MNVLHEAEFSDGDWELIGLQLIKHTDLTTIEAKCHGKPGLCMMDMVFWWLKTESELSWDKLAEAVEKVEGHGEATAKGILLVPKHVPGTADIEAQTPQRRGEPIFQGG